jgi:hypothetical protein
VHGFVATPAGAHSLATSSVQAAPSFGSTSPSATGSLKFDETSWMLSQDGDTRTLVKDPPVRGSLASDTTLAYWMNSANTGGALTVSDGSHAQSVALLAQYMASSFVMPSAGHGGTMITEPPSNQQLFLAHPHA